MPYSKRYGFIEDIGEETDNRCHLCHEAVYPDDYGSPAGPLGRDATTVDHLIPQSHGGPDEPENWLLSHAGCNSSRKTRPVEEVRLELAGTTRKPLSTGEERALVIYHREQQIAEARQQRQRNWGIAGLFALGVAALGGLAWFLFRSKEENSDDSDNGDEEDD